MSDIAERHTPDPLDVALGRRIRLRRKSLGVSQTALGAAVELTFQQVQKYELGKNRVSFSKLVGIARALDCRAADLIQGLEDASTIEAVDDGEDLLATAGALELLTHFARVKIPRYRRSIINLTAALSTSSETAVADDSLDAGPSTARTKWRRRPWARGTDTA